VKAHWYKAGRSFLAIHAPADGCEGMLRIRIPSIRFRDQRRTLGRDFWVTIPWIGPTPCRLGYAERTMLATATLFALSLQRMVLPLTANKSWCLCIQVAHPISG
jgi:hypothetical protein